jgi:hypothetical protein
VTNFTAASEAFASSVTYFAAASDSGSEALASSTPFVASATFFDVSFEVFAAAFASAFAQGVPTDLRQHPVLPPLRRCRYGLARRFTMRFDRKLGRVYMWFQWFEERGSLFVFSLMKFLRC